MRVLFLFLVFFAVGCTHFQKQSNISTFTIRLKPNQDLKNELQAFAKEKSLQGAALVSAVGSLKEVRLRLANQNSPEEFHGFYEVVSLSGTLSADSMHIHMAVSDKTGKTLGGHLEVGCLIYTTMEIVILEQKHLKFSREVDPTYGYKELTIQKVSP